MHIEPGLVESGKLWIGFATATGVLGLTLKQAADTARDQGLAPVLMRSAFATALALFFFEVLPHRPVGVSELHLILGSTLFLVLGAAPAAIGLAAGLLVQGLVFAPTDLPQYGMNVTTLLVPLFGMAALARRIVAPDTPYVEIGYRQALKLSTTYQAGIVGWVAFWVLVGQGLTAASLMSLLSFGASYLLVIAVEPVVDLSVLALAKMLARRDVGRIFERRLLSSAAA